MAQIFVNDTNFLRIYPMENKGQAGSKLVELIQEVGIPSSLHVDGSKEQSSKKWKETCINYDIRQKTTEPHSPWQNCAESAIKELKKGMREIMKRTRMPHKQWDFAAVYISQIKTLSANPLHSLHGRTPYELLTGNTPDISEWTEFDWYMQRSKRTRRA